MKRGASDDLGMLSAGSDCLEDMDGGRSSAGAGSKKRNWRPYNDFDRGYYEEHKRRPAYHEAKKWYDEHKEDFLNCNTEIPTWEELKIHRTRFRVDTAKIREYTNKKRAEKRQEKAKAKAQKAWRKLPALLAFLSLRKEVRQNAQVQWMEFLSTFIKKSMKPYALVMVAVQKFKRLGQDARSVPGGSETDVGMHDADGALADTAAGPSRSHDDDDDDLGSLDGSEDFEEGDELYMDAADGSGGSFGAGAMHGYGHSGGGFGGGGGGGFGGGPGMQGMDEDIYADGADVQVDQAELKAAMAM